MSLIFLNNLYLYNVLLAIATNIPQRIKTSFVVQGHIFTVAKRAQRAANRKNTCKLRKQLPQFYNAHTANAHNTTKKETAANKLYLLVLWAFAPSAVKMMNMFSWFAGAFSICMCFLKLQRVELSRPPYILAFLSYEEIESEAE